MIKYERVRVLKRDDEEFVIGKDTKVDLFNKDEEINVSGLYSKLSDKERYKNFALYFKQSNRFDYPNSGYSYGPRKFQKLFHQILISIADNYAKKKKKIKEYEKREKKKRVKKAKKFEHLPKGLFFYARDEVLPFDFLDPENKQFEKSKLDRRTTKNIVGKIEYLYFAKLNAPIRIYPKRYEGLKVLHFQNLSFINFSIKGKKEKEKQERNSRKFIEDIVNSSIKVLRIDFVDNDVDIKEAYNFFMKLFDALIKFRKKKLIFVVGGANFLFE